MAGRGGISAAEGPLAAVAIIRNLRAGDGRMGWGIPTFRGLYSVLATSSRAGCILKRTGKRLEGRLRLDNRGRRDKWGGEMPLHFGSVGKGLNPLADCPVGGKQPNEDAAGRFARRHLFFGGTLPARGAAKRLLVAVEGFFE